MIGGRVSRTFGSPEGSFEAARAYLEEHGFDPGSGGIATIIRVFPRVEAGEYAGQYPEVAVYAK